MIGVAVPALRPEGNHYLGLDTPNMVDYFTDYLMDGSLVEIAIYVVEKRDSLDTKHASRLGQFTLSKLAQLCEAGIVGLVTWPTTLAARSRQQMDLRPFGGIPRYRTPHTKRFVIRVR
jgi:hypothetical protein